MDKIQIQNEINETDKAINSLNALKIKYENMNKNIIEALEQLKNANVFMNQSKIDFNKSYSSDVAEKQSAKIQNVIDETNMIYKELADIILPASKRAIQNINNNIYTQTEQKSQLTNELKSV